MNSSDNCNTTTTTTTLATTTTTTVLSSILARPPYNFKSTSTFFQKQQQQQSTIRLLQLPPPMKRLPSQLLRQKRVRKPRVRSYRAESDDLFDFHKHYYLTYWLFCNTKRNRTCMFTCVWCKGKFYVGEFLRHYKYHPDIMKRYCSICNDDWTDRTISYVYTHLSFCIFPFSLPLPKRRINLDRNELKKRLTANPSTKQWWSRIEEANFFRVPNLAVDDDDDDGTGKTKEMVTVSRREEEETVTAEIAKVEKAAVVNKSGDDAIVDGNAGSSGRNSNGSNNSFSGDSNEKRYLTINDLPVSYVHGARLTSHDKRVKKLLNYEEQALSFIATGKTKITPLVPPLLPLLPPLTSLTWQIPTTSFSFPATLSSSSSSFSLPPSLSPPGTLLTSYTAITSSSTTLPSIPSLPMTQSTPLSQISSTTATTTTTTTTNNTKTNCAFCDSQIKNSKKLKDVWPRLNVRGYEFDEYRLNVGTALQTFCEYNFLSNEEFRKQYYKLPCWLLEEEYYNNNKIKHQQQQQQTQQQRYELLDYENTGMSSILLETLSTAFKSKSLKLRNVYLFPLNARAALNELLTRSDKYYVFPYTCLCSKNTWTTKLSVVNDNEYDYQGYTDKNDRCEYTKTLLNNVVKGDHCTRRSCERKQKTLLKCCCSTERGYSDFLTHKRAKEEMSDVLDLLEVLPHDHPWSISNETNEDESSSTKRRDVSTKITTNRQRLPTTTTTTKTTTTTRTTATTTTKVESTIKTNVRKPYYYQQHEKTRKTQNLRTFLYFMEQELLRYNSFENCDNYDGKNGEVEKIEDKSCVKDTCSYVGESSVEKNNSSTFTAAAATTAAATTTITNAPVDTTTTTKKRKTQGGTGTRKTSFPVCPLLLHRHVIICARNERAWSEFTTKYHQRFMPSMRLHETYADEFPYACKFLSRNTYSTLCTNAFRTMAHVLDAVAFNSQPIRRHYLGGNFSRGSGNGSNSSGNSINNNNGRSSSGSGSHRTAGCYTSLFDKEIRDTFDENIKILNERRLGRSGKRERVTLATRNNDDKTDGKEKLINALTRYNPSTFVTPNTTTRNRKLLKSSNNNNSGTFSSDMLSSFGRFALWNLKREDIDSSILATTTVTTTTTTTANNTTSSTVNISNFSLSSSPISIFSSSSSSSSSSFSSSFSRYYDKQQHNRTKNKNENNNSNNNENNESNHKEKEKEKLFDRFIEHEWTPYWWEEDHFYIARPLIEHGPLLFWFLEWNVFKSRCLPSFFVSSQIRPFPKYHTLPTRYHVSIDNTRKANFANDYDEDEKEEEEKLDNLNNKPTSSTFFSKKVKTFGLLRIDGNRLAKRPFYITKNIHLT